MKRHPSLAHALWFSATAVLVVAGLLATAVPDTKAQDDPPATAEKLPRAVVDTHDLMSLFNEPLYNYLKKAMDEELNSDEAWATVAERGLQVAEIANLVALRKDGKEWQQFCADLQAAGVDLNKAAKSQDVDATREAYRGVLQRCNACHQKVAPDEAPELKS